MSLTNITSGEFIARLPIVDCCGHLDLPLSKISLHHNFVYHLYHSKITPFKFILKGVPIRCMSDPELQEKINVLSTIFVDNLPILDEKQKISEYFKFVKKCSSPSFGQYNGKVFQEIETAYPLGFSKIKNKCWLNVFLKLIRKSNSLI